MSRFDDSILHPRAALYSQAGVSAGFLSGVVDGVAMVLHTGRSVASSGVSSR